jgi:tetratricopeptide (TPR) repeat protein
MRNAMELGISYNVIGRPESAIRHLATASKLARENDTEPLTVLIIAVETAEAHLALAQKGKDPQKHLNQAAEVLHPVAGVVVDKKELLFRRDLALARAFALRGRYKRSLPLYLAAVEEVDGGAAEAAAVHAECGDAAARAGDRAVAIAEWQKAREVYLALGMEEEAQRLLPKIASFAEEEKPAEEEEDAKEPTNPDPPDEPAQEKTAEEAPAPEVPVEGDTSQEEPAPEDAGQEEPAPEVSAEEDKGQEEPAEEDKGQEEPAPEVPAEGEPGQEEPAQEETAQDEQPALGDLIGDVIAGDGAADAENGAEDEGQGGGGDAAPPDAEPAPEPTAEEST